MPRPRARAFLLNVSILVATVALALPLAELILRLVLPAPKVYRALPPNLESTFQAKSIEGIRGPALFKVNSMGARGREWAPERRSEYRVLAMGGSATESLANDQTRAWTTLLEQRLGSMPDGRRVWIGNIGRSGLSARHHVLQMQQLLDVYEPDLVLLLVGVNDLASRLKQGDAYDPGVAERKENAARLAEQSFAVAPGRFAGEWPDDPWPKRTRLWMLLRLIKYRVLKVPEFQDPEGLYLTRWRAMRASGSRSATLPSLEADLDRYAADLREIVRLARVRPTRLALMTQPALWRADLTEDEKGRLWMGGVGDFRSRPGSLYYEASVLAAGLDAYNDRLRQVCRETGLACVDLAAAVPRTTQYFWDDCHFTDAGQVLVADTIARTLQTLRP